MSSGLWYPSVKESPILGLMGVGGGVGGNLAGGASAEPEGWWPAGTELTWTAMGGQGAAGPTSTQMETVYGQTSVMTAGKTAYQQDSTTGLAPLQQKTGQATAQGIHRLVIPNTGVWRFKVYGAQGGATESKTGGSGAWIQTEGTLEMGDVVLLVVGQQGYPGKGNHGAGGGGGSFAYLESASGWQNYAYTDIIAAAGGGSGGNNAGSAGYGDAASTPNGAQGEYSPGGAGYTTSWQRPAPGYGGMLEYISGTGRNYAAGAGAGWYGRCEDAGEDYTQGQTSSYKGATSAGFNNGSTHNQEVDNDPGGLTGFAYSGNSGRNNGPNGVGDRQGSFNAYPTMNGSEAGYAGAWMGGRSPQNTSEQDYTGQGNGGFGGGGGGCWNCGGSGAGGGFSGGMSSGCSSISGGGSCYGRTSEATMGNYSGWTVTEGQANHTGQGQILVKCVSHTKT